MPVFQVFSGRNYERQLAAYRSLKQVTSSIFRFFLLYCRFVFGNFAKIRRAWLWGSFQEQPTQTCTSSTFLQPHWHPWEHWSPSAYTPWLKPALLPCYGAAFKTATYLVSFVPEDWISSALSLKVLWGIIGFVAPSFPTTSCCLARFIAIISLSPLSALSSIFTSRLRDLDYLSQL